MMMNFNSLCFMTGWMFWMLIIGVMAISFVIAFIAGLISSYRWATKWKNVTYLLRQIGLKKADSNNLRTAYRIAENKYGTPFEGKPSMFFSSFLILMAHEFAKLDDTRPPSDETRGEG